METSKNSKYIAMVFLAIVAICAIIITVNVLRGEERETVIEYSEYDYIKDKINDYNDVYSKGINNSNSSVLLVEDKTNLVFMITIPRASDGGKDIATIDFTNMKMQNISYDRYDKPIIRSEMSIDEHYTISSASTYLYSKERYKTYTKADTEWQQIQQIALGAGKGVNVILEGNDGKGVDVFNKTIQELKNKEYK